MNQYKGTTFFLKVQNKYIKKRKFLYEKVKYINQLFKYRIDSIPEIGGKYYCPVCEYDVKKYNSLRPFLNWKFVNSININGTIHYPENYETFNIDSFFCPICSAQDKARLYAYYINKFIINNKYNNEHSKFLCVICNNIILKNTNNKIYQLFKEGYANNTLCYINNLENIIKNHFNNELVGKTIGIWGLAFKPYTDDIREAPALYNIEHLLELGCKINVYDPEAMPNTKELLGDTVTFSKNPYDAIENADALLIVTEWPQFRTPDFERMESLLKNKVIFDGRNLYEMAQMKELGYTYYSIGRGVVR